MRQSGKTAKCYDDLLKMMENKDISTYVLYTKDKSENILYTKKYVDKLQQKIDKAIEYIEEYTKDTNFVNGYELLDILRGE